MNGINSFTKRGLAKILRIVRKSKAVQNFLDADATKNLLLSGRFCEILHQNEVDKVYSYARRFLFNLGYDWKHSPEHAITRSEQIYKAIKRYKDIEGAVYMDVGCGTTNPYGMVTIMYLNGAKSSIAVDIQDDKSPKRYAEALFDLLITASLYPDRWHFSKLNRNEFLRRIEHFDLCALQKGDLNKGIGDLPLRRIVSDVQKLNLDHESIDIMGSHAVLEHFIDIESALSQLFVLLRKGGIAFHAVDLSDHRFYNDPSGYDRWSFLFQLDWNGDTNRLRASEIKKLIERVGYLILETEEYKEELPDSIRKKLKGRFVAMDDEELSIHRIDCIITKT